MDYQGNPNKEKNIRPEKQIEKVVTGEAIQKPKSIGRKFKEIFFGGDFKSSARFVTADVILPALRDALVDGITAGARRAVYGESMYRRNRPVDYRPRVSYNSPLSRPTYADYPRDPRDPRYRANLPDQPNPYRRERREHNDIVLAQRSDAELVVERLLDIIEKYEVASLADLYDLLGWPTQHVDNKWGWTYLNNVEVRQVRDGYLIDLPPLEAV
jgi:hypothetical protein